MPTMRPYYRFMRFLSQGGFALYFHGRVFGRENVPLTGGVVLATNHQSFFDPLSATCALHREGNYLARDTLFRNRWFGRLIRSVNAFPVKLGAGDIGAIKEILRRLKAGKLVTVFPESTRTRDGSIGPINENTMALAKRAGAAVVPAVIDGAFESWPRTSLLPSPSTVYVTYAEAIDAGQVRDWTCEKIAQTVSVRMNAAMRASRAKRRRAAADSWRHTRPERMDRLSREKTDGHECHPLP